MKNAPDQKKEQPDENKETGQDKQTKQKPANASEISLVEFFLIGTIAVGKDVIDAGATLAIIGIPLTPVLNIGAVAALWMWCIIRLQRFPTKRFVGSAVLEFIPLFNALPFWTAFMLLLIIQQKFPKTASAISLIKYEKKQPK